MDKRNLHDRNVSDVTHSFVALNHSTSFSSTADYISLRKHACTHKRSIIWKKVQVGKDQEKAQAERDSHSKNRGEKKNQTNNQVPIP